MAGLVFVVVLPVLPVAPLSRVPKNYEWSADPPLDYSNHAILVGRLHAISRYH